ncbi:hypothetical protein SAMN04515672_0253 [Natronorubrum texcoconense]|uniref:Uncharacterized protein n=1 Tax=Natronorubrum texcoconense TaxID=1095776 RepID=A0A1G8SYU7_9EURY|nr:hypothetical protein SAMN04515672_0253 [Natronorubrum texcoconense]
MDMVHIALSGLPIGTTLAVLVTMLMPVVAYLLYRIDAQRGDGRVTVFGKR